MRTARATICWGIGLLIVLSLPHSERSLAATGLQVPTAPAAPPSPPSPPPSAAAPQAPSAPAAPSSTRQPANAQKPPPRRPLYERAWIQDLPAAGTRFLTIAAGHLIVSGGQLPMEGRSLEDGQVAWTEDIRPTSTPTSLDDIVLAITEDRLVAIEAASGRTRWSTPVGQSAGLAASRHVAIVADEHGLRAFQSNDGESLWEATLEMGAPTVVAVGPAQAVVFSHQSLQAFGTSDGHPLWQTPLDLTPHSITATAAMIYFTSADGFVCAYRAKDGGHEWCFPVRVRPVGAPLPDARHVYVAFLDGMIRVFDGHNGARRQLLAAMSRPVDGPEIAGTFLAVPLVTSEFVVFNSADGFKSTRVPGFDPAETPPTTQAATTAADGSVLAMIMTSPARTSLVCLKRTSSETAKPSDGAPPAAHDAASTAAAPPASEPTPPAAPRPDAPSAPR